MLWSMQKKQDMQQAPHDNIGIMNEVMEEIEELVGYREHGNQQDISGGYMIRVWLFGSVLCVLLIGLVLYQQRIKKTCNYVRLKYKSEQHIV